MSLQMSDAPPSPKFGQSHMSLQTGGVRSSPEFDQSHSMSLPTAGCSLVTEKDRCGEF